MKQKPTLIGSIHAGELDGVSGLERARVMASKFYGGSEVSLHESWPNRWEVHAGRGFTGMTVTRKGNRLRLEIGGGA